MTAFVDTSALLALLDAHTTRGAVLAWQRLAADDTRLITTN